MTDWNHSRRTVAKRKPSGYDPGPMTDANLYLDKVDLARYLSDSECKKCGSQSCKELVDKLRQKDCLPGDLNVSRDLARSLEMALDLEGLLPRVPMLQMPQPGTAGIMELNSQLRAGQPAQSAGAQRLPRLVLPGLASGMETEIASATGFRVEVGPVCAAELPLFFGAEWKPSQG